MDRGFDSRTENCIVNFTGEVLRCELSRSLSMEARLAPMQ
ncbi:hypothetical protein C1A50_3833 [Paenibacillus polymyxa]|nr:hypothetical protein C1A50_3833 [Paenibacillus polymyxa]